MKYLFVFAVLMLAVCVTANIVDENGILCESDLHFATMDLVVVVELTDSTLNDRSAYATTLLSYLYFLPLTNSGGGIRLALVTYGKSATVSYSFDDTQNLLGFKSALIHAMDNAGSSEAGDIQGGLSTAFNYIESHGSNFVPAILLFASTYDDSGVNDPNVTAMGIKSNMIKIMTLTYQPAGGVASPRIAALASPGLAFYTKYTPPNVTNNAFAALNCVCPPGYTQLILNTNTYYSECFKVAGQGVRNTLILNDVEILATVQSQARKDFIERNLVDNTIPYMAGLSRYDKVDNNWSWDTYEQEFLPYTNFPAFVTQPTSNNLFGYFRLIKNGLNIGLDSEDGNTYMWYIVAQRASDYTKKH